SNGIQTVTDENGNFQIAAAVGDSLEFAFIGYQTVTRAVVNNDPIVETLVLAGATDLEEVVIVGYGTQKKSNLTGAVSAVNARELTKISPANLSNTLAGRAPGVNVTNTSGLSGATSSIRIRGGFGEPLYVIDGVVRDKAAFDALEAFEVDQMS